MRIKAIGRGNDSVFVTGMIEEEFAAAQTDGEIFMIVSGKSTSLYQTKYALGIEANGLTKLQ
ncbi:hypothetical protein LI951_15025 [Enterococcus sp. BWT-B8]|uniref:hypothetical protein n=1 Tax=unclassified Enterococcus TaxID=2608891 RepID=UPI001E32142F|nr:MULTISPECIES: hypothetical protein [unclassified Enterococcus]MCB5953369.1 hypothetical protein [Enterococcus sp. BWT-B8]MCB5954204.1 hypothetical protein [Enterococcus sp. CWB-B31]